MSKVASEPFGLSDEQREIQALCREFAQREVRPISQAVDEVWAERAAAYPSNRVVTPEEIAETVAFLASEEASGINGEGVTVALGGLW